MTGAWKSKANISTTNTAHFVDEATGEPACAPILRRAGGGTWQGFGSSFVERRAFDHLCTTCARIARHHAKDATACVCGGCSVRRAS